jgi:triacylglycerol lipase
MKLVFASGFLVPQHIIPGALEYFNGLKKHFDDGGKHKAIFPWVPPVGTCDARASVLAEKIQARFPDGEFHIIAHSMGGLDSRVLIAKNLNGLAEPGRIKSLTTIATPHAGSPVADLLAGPRPGDARRVLYDSLRDAIGRAGIDTGALANLTTEEAAKIPNAMLARPHIRYRSYATVGRSGGSLVLPTCLALVPFYQYIRLVSAQQGRPDEPNDGLVPFGSAQYGEFQKEDFWPCDHADAVGYNLDPVVFGGFSFDHVARYDAIVTQLEAG